jgi:hypothetical protein
LLFIKVVCSQDSKHGTHNEDPEVHNNTHVTGFLKTVLEHKEDFLEALIDLKEEDTFQSTSDKKGCVQEANESDDVDRSLCS